MATAIKTDRVASAKDLPKVDPNLAVKTDRPKHVFQFVVLSSNRSTRKALAESASEKVPHEGHHPTTLVRRRVAGDRRPLPLRLLRLARHFTATT